MLVLLTGCSAFGDRDPVEPDPTPSKGRNTVDAASVGAGLTVTATVASVITPTSFVVKDVDLPREGLLVLTETASALHPPDLVTVSGAIILFSFADLAARHELADASRYADFEGRKALEARDVRSWAQASP